MKLSFVFLICKKFFDRICAANNPIRFDRPQSIVAFHIKHNAGVRRAIAARNKAAVFVEDGFIIFLIFGEERLVVLHAVQPNVPADAALCFAGEAVAARLQTLVPSKVVP